MCLYAAEVADAQKVEDALHATFDCDRPNKKREFFTTPPDRIITLLKAFSVSDESDSIQRVLDDTASSEDKLAQLRIAAINERRSRLRFSEIGIQPGAVLEFKNDPTKTCRVVDDKTVEYEGQVTSLSRLATTLSSSSTIVQGALWFTYEGERLTDRRDRLESEEGT